MEDVDSFVAGMVFGPLLVGLGMAIGWKIWFHYGKR